MRLRYILVLGMAGLFIAWKTRDPMSGTIVLFGSIILYWLRCIEYQIGDLKGRVNSAPSNRRISDRELLLAWAFVRSPNELMQNLPRVLGQYNEDSAKTIEAKRNQMEDYFRGAKDFNELLTITRLPQKEQHAAFARRLETSNNIGAWQAFFPDWD